MIKSKNNILTGVFLVGLGATSYGMLATFVKLAYAEGFTNVEVTISQFVYGLLGLLVINFYNKSKTPNQIKRMYPSASFLANNRVVFNIKGNAYRLIIKINYDFDFVWIRFIGTHALYDKIDATKI